MDVRRTSALAVATITLSAGTAAGQSGMAGYARSISPLGQFLVSLLVTLLVGGVLLGAAPEFVARTVEVVRGSPFTTGLIGTVATVVAVVVLAVVSLFGLLGLIIGLPLTAAFAVVAAAGNALGGTALGTTLLDRVTQATHWKGLLLGAPLVAGVNTVTPALVPVGFVVSLLGIGAIARERGPL